MCLGPHALRNRQHPEDDAFVSSSSLSDNIKVVPTGRGREDSLEEDLEEGLGSSFD